MKIMLIITTIYETATLGHVPCQILCLCPFSLVFPAP